MIKEKINQIQSWIDSACWFEMISIKSLSVNWIWTNSNVMFIWIRIVENVHKTTCFGFKMKRMFLLIKIEENSPPCHCSVDSLVWGGKKGEFDIHRMSQFHWTLIEWFVYRPGVHMKSEYGKPGRCLNNKQRASWKQQQFHWLSVVQRKGFISSQLKEKEGHVEWDREREKKKIGSSNT